MPTAQTGSFYVFILLVEIKPSFTDSIHFVLTLNNRKAELAGDLTPVHRDGLLSVLYKKIRFFSGPSEPRLAHFDVPSISISSSNSETRRFSASTCRFNTRI